MLNGTNTEDIYSQYADFQSLLCEAERARVTSDWNLVAQYLREAVKICPNHVFLRYLSAEIRQAEEMVPKNGVGRWIVRMHSKMVRPVGG
jgi:hypothetical protein